MRIALYAHCNAQAGYARIRYRAYCRRVLLDLDSDRYRTFDGIEPRDITLVRRAAQKKTCHALKIERTVLILHRSVVEKHRLPRLIVAVGKTLDFTFAHRINNTQRLRGIQSIRRFIRGGSTAAAFTAHFLSFPSLQAHIWQCS